MAISAAFLPSALSTVVASKGGGAPSRTAANPHGRVAFSTAPARYAPLASVVATRGAEAAPGRVHRRHSVRCESSPAPPDSEMKEPLKFWQKTVKALKSAAENATWKSLAALILLVGCTALGYFAKKENQKALFIIDVLDKSSKAYKTALEFGVLITAVIISLAP